MGIAHRRGDGARINCYTCFVPVYCPVGKAPDKHGNAAGEALPIDAKLDLLLKVARLEYDPLAQLPSDVVKALRAGQKIEAIKRQREAMSISLAEAKSVIEEGQRRASL